MSAMPGPMGGSAADHATADLMPRHCPSCAYSVAGLPEAGTCPECGAAYAADDLAVFGWNVGPNASPANGRGGRAMAGGVVIAVVALGYALTIAVGTQLPLEEWVYPVGGIGVGALLLFVVLFKRSSSSRGYGAPYQLRLTRYGYVFRDGIGPVRLFPWTADVTFTVEHHGDGRQRIVVTRGRKPGWFSVERSYFVRFAIEFEATDGAAELVAAQVAHWRGRDLQVPGQWGT